MYQQQHSSWTLHGDFPFKFDLSSVIENRAQ